MTYLEEAAEALRSAKSAASERYVERYLQIADGFTRLAAIERGLPPGVGAFTQVALPAADLPDADE